QLLLRILCVSDLCVGPERLRHHALLDLGEETLDRGHVVSILAPPDPPIGIESLKPLSGDDPIPPRCGTMYYPPRWRCDRIRAFSVVVSCGKISRLPWPTGIVVRILVRLVLVFTPGNRIWTPEA